MFVKQVTFPFTARAYKFSNTVMLGPIKRKATNPSQGLVERQEFISEVSFIASVHGDRQSDMRNVFQPIVSCFGQSVLMGIDTV